MVSTLEELTALRGQMAIAGLSTAEIDAKIETLKGEMAIENDFLISLNQYWVLLSLL